MFEQILIGLTVVIYLGSAALAAAEVAYLSEVAGAVCVRLLQVGFAVHTRFNHPAMGGSWPGAGGRHGGDTFFSFLDAGSHILIGPLALSGGGRGTDPRTRCLLPLRHRRGYVSGTPSGSGRAHESLVGGARRLELGCLCGFCCSFLHESALCSSRGHPQEEISGCSASCLGACGGPGDGFGYLRGLPDGRPHYI